MVVSGQSRAARSSAKPAPDDPKMKRAASFGSSIFSCSVPWLEYSSSAGNQVNDQHNHGNHQQQVDQAAANMEAESQKPENQQNRENCPKHVFPSHEPRQALRCELFRLVLLPTNTFFHVASQNCVSTNYLIPPAAWVRVLATTCAPANVVHLEFDRRAI